MPAADSFFSAANLLSLARLPLALLFAVALVAPWGGPWAAAGVLFAAGVTDALDGHVARRAQARRAAAAGRRGGNGATPAGIGSWLDPICDKLFVATVLAAIWIRSHPPLTLLALILARELAQLPLSVVYAAIPALRRWLRYDFRASVLGKGATVLQFGAITALLFDSDMAWGMAGVSFLIGMLALGDYLRRAIWLGRRRLHDAPGSPAAPADDAAGTAPPGPPSP